MAIARSKQHVHLMKVLWLHLAWMSNVHAAQHDEENARKPTIADITRDACSAAERSKYRQLNSADLPNGVVSVVHKFGADPRGVQDSTNAIQEAIIYSRTHNATLLLPLGCYVISDTLNATSPRNGRWQPVVLVGETSLPGNRPALILKNNTARFETGYKPVIDFECDWCIAPGSAVHGTPEDCAPGQRRDFPPYNFNQVFQSINIVLGGGNPGAAGVRMLGAQGSAVQDVTVHAAPEAIAGVVGGNGAGATFANVTVFGARFGLDMRVVQGAPVVVGATLIGQTCAGIVFGGSTDQHPSMTLTATGVYITGSPRLAGIITGKNLEDFNDAECSHVKADPQTAYEDQEETPFSNDDDMPAPHKYGWKRSLTSPAGLVDSVINLSNEDVSCVSSGGSLYLNNVYTRGCRIAVNSSFHAPIPSNATSISTVFDILAIGRTPQEEPHAPFAFPVYDDGERSLDGLVDARGVNEYPPGDYRRRHVWGDATPTWQSPQAVCATDLGAKGDGVTDDWASLQAALDAHDVVVLPKGFYRVSKTLVVSRPHGALVGVGRTLVFLMPMTSGLQGGEVPVLSISANDVTMGFLTVVTWDHLPAYAIDWSGNGLWRQAFATRESENLFPPLMARVAENHPSPLPRHPFDRALIVVSGGGAFYDLNLDFGCCFGDLLPNPPVVVPPAIASLSEILLQKSNYRTLLINGSTSGARFYAHNTEQDNGDAHTEIRYSHNVTLYGSKAESNYAVVWIRDSDRIAIHGYGGNAAAFANSTRYESGRAQFMPSLFRVQRSTRVLMANLVDSGRVTDSQSPSVLVAAGNGTDPAKWNMLLWQDFDGVCEQTTTVSHASHRIPTAKACTATKVFDRPVLWRWMGL
eukprot:m.1618360 g.1618360  ORF g.1618360 m.1618360 type:complete len:865 (-) comp25377_c0_seq9:4607-7201(-)